LIDHTTTSSTGPTPLRKFEQPPIPFLSLHAV
jgi:hypothetical protein